MARRRYGSSSYDDRRGDYEYSRGGSGYRRSSSGGCYRRDRRREERTVEMVSFGLILVLFVVTLLYPIPAVTVCLVGGGILVGAAVFQWQRRWRVNPVTWIAGVLMLLIAYFGLQPGNSVPLGIWLPMGLFALVIVASFFTGEF